MGVLRRLSHAFNANNIPNFSQPGLTIPPDSPSSADGERDRQLHDPLHVLPPSQHEPTSSTSAHPYNTRHSNLDYDRDNDDDYSPSFHSRASFDSLEAGDQNSMQPSYLESTPGNVNLDHSDEEDDDDNEGGDKYALMTQHLYSRAKNQGWFRSKKIAGMGIVSIRMKRRQYK